MQEWHIAALFTALGLVGGGLRWFFGWLDGRARVRHERALELEQKRQDDAIELEATRHKHAQEIETAKATLATRIETMQNVFLDALRKIQADADEKYERHRAEHLADAKLFAATLAAKERKRDTESPSSR